RLGCGRAQGPAGGGAQDHRPEREAAGAVARVDGGGLRQLGRGRRQGRGERARRARRVPETPARAQSRLLSVEPIEAVDAHHHLWDAVENSYPYLSDGSRDRMHGKALPRRYRIEDYLRDIDGLRIAGSVHIQCGWNPADPVGETRWLEGVAQRHGYPSAIVAFADLSSP